MRSSDVEIDEAKRDEIQQVITNMGLAWNDESELSGWSGGEVWLVPTDKAIEKWKPIAVRKLR